VNDVRIELTTSVAELPGVGRRRAESLRRLGLRCVADLLRHLPARYERETDAETIGGIGGGELDQMISVEGEVATTRTARGRRSRFEAVLEDETGTLLLTWFNAPWLRTKLHPGTRIRVTGKRGRRPGG
jgi:ATP-dependent DNA helicase RecG